MLATIISTHSAFKNTMNFLNIYIIKCVSLYNLYKTFSAVSTFNDVKMIYRTITYWHLPLCIVKLIIRNELLFLNVNKK